MVNTKTKDEKTPLAPNAAAVTAPNTGLSVGLTNVDIELSSKDDPALIAAWRRFLDYDRVSTTQKKQSARYRDWVIWIQFITSTVAILSTFVVVLQTVLPLWLVDAIQWLFRMALVLLPIISVGLMNYSNQFASSSAWIEYRVGAETIRQKIYQYRMRAGDFHNLTTRKAQEKLLDIINRADQRIDEANATLPYMKPMDESKLDRKQKLKYLIATSTDSRFDESNPTREFDNGLTELSVQEYIDKRVRKQIDWYTGRIEGDYTKMRQYRLRALLVAGAGSFFAALGQNLEALVAITTASGVLLNSLADARMYGATYSIFHWTASKLRIEMNKWDILTEAEKQDPAIRSRFVSDTENIFKQEQQMWRKSAIESQQLIDRSLNASLKTNGREVMSKLSEKTESDEELLETPRVLPSVTQELHVLITGKESASDTPLEESDTTETPKG